MTTIIAALSALWGIVRSFFGGGDSNEKERAAGEKIGKLETENASLRKYIETEKRVGDAGRAVSDDPRSVWNDPDNAANPANRHR